MFKFIHPKVDSKNVSRLIREMELIKLFNFHAYRGYIYQTGSPEWTHVAVCVPELSPEGFNCRIGVVKFYRGLVASIKPYRGNEDDEIWESIEGWAKDKYTDYPSMYPKKKGE